MSRGLNKVVLIGNLGKDPDITYSQSGLTIAKFSLATTESKKNTAGNWEEKTSWHSIVLFGKTAEAAGQYLTKGSQVYIEGSIDYQEWEKDGEKQRRTVIAGFKMLMLGKGNGQPSAAKEDDEALPF